MAAIMRDSIAGRYQSLANRMAALTHRTLRALGAKPNHPGYRALHSREVTSPTIEDWMSGIESWRNRSRQRETRDSQRGRLAALLSAGQSRPTPRRTSQLATCGSVPPAPDLAAAIRAARKE